jgi:hypothetical protein
MEPVHMIFKAVGSSLGCRVSFVGAGFTILSQTEIKKEKRML